ncbi:MAG: hypothetical protein LBF58_09635 [Deltaproteobacteria bacterium]|jgi:hypothetical protein|nr:hypothetical protein [Deltaproteobacteria bacterium]
MKTLLLIVLTFIVVGVVSVPVYAQSDAFYGAGNQESFFCGSEESEGGSYLIAIRNSVGRFNIEIDEQNIPDSINLSSIESGTPIKFDMVIRLVPYGNNNCHMTTMQIYNFQITGAPQPGACNR